jgi:hypothetical protein
MYIGWGPNQSHCQYRCVQTRAAHMRVGRVRWNSREFANIGSGVSTLAAVPAVHPIRTILPGHATFLHAAHPAKTVRDGSGSVGDSVDGLSLFQGGGNTACNSCLVRFLVAGASPLHLAIGQACTAPDRPALLGGYWRAFGHGDPVSVA